MATDPAFRVSTRLATQYFRPPLITATELRAQDLISLLKNQAAGLLVKNFYPRDCAPVLAERLLTEISWQGYAVAPDFKFGQGTAYYEIASNPAALKKYYADRIAQQQFRRKLTVPFQSPLDSLVGQLVEIWPMGVCCEDIGDGPMPYGVPRVLHGGAEPVLPHVDILAWDAPPGNTRASELRAQLSALVYPSFPENGGELALWWFGLSKEQYESARLPGSYGLDEEIIGPPTVVFRPSVGDLVIFRADHIHAVRAVPPSGVPRISISTFIGYRSDKQPLSIWS